VDFASISDSSQHEVAEQPQPELPDSATLAYRSRIAGETTEIKIQKRNVELVVNAGDFSLNSWQTFAAERTATTVKIERNGEELLTYRDFFPLVGNCQGSHYTVKACVIW